MKLSGDLHTHTTYSHGKATIEENILRAIEVGLEKIVISDHGSGHFFYGVKRKHWIEMRNAINEMRKKYPNIEILLGIEANIVGLHGNIDIRDEEFKMYDVIYVGYHYGIIPHRVSDFFMFYCLNVLAKVFPVLKNRAMDVNTQALIKVMEKHPIFMITHPGAKIPINIDAIAKKAAELDIVLEVNANHGHLSKEEIKVASKYNVKFAVNSDSHLLENIGNVEKGLKAIEYAAIPIENIINVKED